MQHININVRRKVGRLPCVLCCGWSRRNSEE